jgi:hypothetical protein
MSRTLDSVRARSAKAKELLASQLLAWDVVMAAIGDAAGQGYDKVAISPEIPVNIKSTEAAAATVGKLTRAGYRCDWLTRRPRPDGPEFVVLEIDWSPREQLSQA